MKQLIFINGTMGVGKSSTCQELVKLIQPGVLLDGDWCWQPTIKNEQTKQMVMDNIIYLLRNYLRCPDYETVLFCWVMHRQSVMDQILSALEEFDFELYRFTLTCSEDALRERIMEDVKNGLRSADVLDRAIPRLQKYDAMDTRKIDVGSISARQAANVIADQL